jgi:hydrocephalus-inducing protein
LEGDSSLISARINDKEIDLGEQRFCEWTTRELIIENTGKVTFEFKVSLASIKRKGFIEVTPLSGKIVGGDKQKLTVKVCAVMPDAFKEQFTVQMGYFEPETIVVKGVGVYPSILANFPRIENPEFDKKLKEEVDKYSK